MFARSIAEFLSNNDFGEIDKNIFINTFPSRTDISDAICVYDRQSYSIRSRARNSVDYHCQIRVRNNKTSIAEQEAFEIFYLLEQGYIYDGNEKRFTIRPLNPPTFLMFDEAGRANWILNVTGLSLNYGKEDIDGNTGY